MRLFFAVNLDEDVRDRVMDAIGCIGIDDPPWRWVARGNLHLTMKFLGDMDERRVADLVRCAEAACRDVPAFRLRLGRLGGFPSLRRPRVLFYEADAGVDSLRRLADRLDRALEARLDIARERRPFRAHATIARIRSPISSEVADRLAAAPPVENGSQTIGRLSLMQSHLRREGAVYQSLKEIALPKTK